MLCTANTKAPEIKKTQGPLKIKRPGLAAMSHCRPSSQASRPRDDLIRSRQAQAGEGGNFSATNTALVVFGDRSGTGRAPGAKRRPSPRSSLRLDDSPSV